MNHDAQRPARQALQYYQPGYDPSLLERTNVTAVAELVAPAHQAGVGVFVHVSSTGTKRVQME